MSTNPPPEILTPGSLTFMSELDECQKRHYVATLAMSSGNIRKVSKNMRVSKNTIYKGISELNSGYKPALGRVRRDGGGRKTLLSRHPEWIAAFKTVVAPHTAGLPQDDQVIWVSLSAPQIAGEMAKAGYKVSEYIVRQLLKSFRFRRRSFLKDLPMKEVEDRDAQFRNIADIRFRAEAVGLPIISIDTKKKEMVGNFRRDGKVYCIGQPKSFDHDFLTFSDARIVPHGIYDVTKNIGYMTIGTSHDTSKFVCDNIEMVWRNHMKSQYPTANTIVILCDGGGSNSSSHRIVKQDLMDLANKLCMKLLVMHYPPYCSKFNPIEHRLFSQITRSWSGAPILDMQDAVSRAAKTTTSKGLTVYVNINNKNYDIQRTIDKSYGRKLKTQIVFQQKLPKWNYLIKPTG